MQNTSRKIQCRCGHLQGTLASAAPVTRLRCYCKDCQAYAQKLGDATRVLDAFGGTDVVATLQQHVSFTQGVESLACLSLSDQGMLRWYASCCNTPIANTGRDPKLSFASLVHCCLGNSAAALDATYGAAYAPVNAKHASAMKGLFATARIIATVLRARANGSWKHSPFFQPGSATPVAAPQVRK